MKKTLIAFASMLPLVLAGSAFAKDATTTLKVSGWHCSGCAQETEAAVKDVKGVKSATADFDKKTLVVAYDDAKANPGVMEKAVSKAGYKVEK
ncbi:MAG: heavy-metal-associated domain-containing protein [Deltaproteobacteria bacterium]